MLSFSCGRQSCCCCASISIPKKIRDVIGPSVFSSATWIPILEQTYRMAEREPADREGSLLGPAGGNHQDCAVTEGTIGFVHEPISKC